MRTYLHERPDGVVIEYRRYQGNRSILLLEHRELRKDGTPHSNEWLPVSDSHLLWLQRAGSDIVHLIELE